MRPVAALEKPQIAVARDVDQPFDRAAVARVVDEDRRRHLVPVPRVVRVILEVALDRAGRDIDREGRRGVQVVARTLIAHPGAAVAGAPEGEVGRGIVVAGHPHRAAAVLPLIALRPRLAAGLARRGHRKRAPHLLAALDVERCEKAANAVLAARRADHDLAVGDERRHRHVVAIAVVLDLARPDFLSGCARRVRPARLRWRRETPCRRTARHRGSSGAAARRRPGARACSASRSVPSRLRARSPDCLASRRTSRRR